MRFSTLIIVLSMGVGLTVLSALGTWQVQRLYWKEALIERVNSRVALEPILLSTLEGKNLSREEHEYTPVKTVGTYDHSKEVYFFTTNKKGASGWNVHTPLELESGAFLIVNRGFVFFNQRGAEYRPEAQVTGNQNISGLLRIPFDEKPGALPDNTPESREFYWRDIAAMYDVMHIPEDKRLAVIVDLNDLPVPGGFPKGGTTIISFSNNHLQYAVTWYGLALTLLGVGGYFLYSRSRTKTDVG